MKTRIHISMIAIAGLSACTAGVVYDEADSAYLGRAKVKFQSPNLSGQLQTDPVVNGVLVGINNDIFSRLGTSGISALTWDAVDWGSNGAHGVYYLNPYGNVTYGTSLSVQVPTGWNRIRVTRSGYDERVFYRNHFYSDCQVPMFQGPISGNAAFPFVPPTVGPFWDPGSVGGATKCGLQHFGLRKSSVAYPLDPDLIVDVRSLRDWGISTDCRGISTTATHCLRFSVATVNVGAGPLELRRRTATGPIEQVRRDSAGVTSRNVVTRLPASSTFVLGGDGHDHWHLTGWAATRLRRIAPGCTTEATAANCPVAATGNKIGFCFMDTNIFDSGLPRFVRTFAFRDGVCQGVDAVRMGISVGFYDLYGRILPGQGISIRGLFVGDYWLEVELNPPNESGQRPVIESDYTNNITRVRVTLSEF